MKIYNFYSTLVTSWLPPRTQHHVHSNKLWRVMKEKWAALRRHGTIFFFFLFFASEALCPWRFGGLRLVFFLGCQPIRNFLCIHNCKSYDHMNISNIVELYNIKGIETFTYLHGVGCYACTHTLVGLQHGVNVEQYIFIKKHSKEGYRMR